MRSGPSAMRILLPPISRTPPRKVTVGFATSGPATAGLRRFERRGRPAPRRLTRLQDLLDVRVLLGEDLPTAVVAPHTEKVRVGGEGLSAPDAPEHGRDSTGRGGLSLARRGDLFLRARDRGRRLEDVGVRCEARAAAAALEDPARDAVKRGGRAARAGGRLRPRAVDVEHAAPDPDPVPGSHPGGRADLLRALAHASSPFAIFRRRSPCANARSTMDLTSSGENAPTRPFCIATTRPVSSVATVRRP